MTPGARVAASIEVLDQVVSGQPVEQVLTRWGRQNRYAGSKDRAAIRDHVFDVLRALSSSAHAGGGQTGRALMIGLLRLQGIPPKSVFTGHGHAPSQLLPEESTFRAGSASKAVLWNLPEWLLPEFERSLGPDAEPTAIALQYRASAILRVNLKKGDQGTAIKMLSGDGVCVEPNPLSPTALTVTEGARRLRQSQTYQSGLVELQDASSQAVVDLLPQAHRVLDYCSGGGGKALAVAAASDAAVFAHDLDPNRMTDLPVRAKRAGAHIACLRSRDLVKHGPFDVVVCDVPCSGSGAWRRSPEGKWSLTQEKLTSLTAEQDRILEKAREYVNAGGSLVYATCSVFSCENEDRVKAFLARNADWKCSLMKRFPVSEFGDGFFTAHLKREWEKVNST